MNQKTKWFHILLCIIFAIILLIERNAAAEGCRAGIALCLQTVIPSIFPFCILSGYISQVAGLLSSGLLDRLGRLLHMNSQTLSVFLAGSLGGYPLGAQCIWDMYAAGSVEKKEANRMLTFCNNCGPAFILGFGNHIFADFRICVGILIVHVISAFLVGRISASAVTHSPPASLDSKIDPLKLIRKGISTMATVCAWIILFRSLHEIFQPFLSRWLPPMIRLIVMGLTEMSNGCCQLQQIPNQGLKLILFSVFVTFGGICVFLQTASVAKTLDMKQYLLGKFAQVAVTILLIIPLQLLLPVQQRFYLPLGFTLSAIAYLLLYILGNKSIHSRNFPIGHV